MRSKTLLDEITRVLTQKPTGESLLLRGDTPISELPSAPKSEEILDPIEKLFDTWGMRSNLGGLAQMNPLELHTLLTGGFSPSKQ